MARSTNTRKSPGQDAEKAVAEDRPKPKKERTDDTRVNFAISRQLHREFKLKAVAEGLTLKEVLEEAIRNFIARP